jgi:hypothetical protein
MKRGVLIFSWLLITFSIQAEEFKTTAAKDAVLKHKIAIEKAEADYKRELEAALVSAMKSTDLDEANAIKAELNSLSGKGTNAEPKKEVAEPNKTEKEKPKVAVAKLPFGVIAILYDRDNYEGKSQTINTVGRLGSPTIGGDAVRSVKVAAGYKVDLYTDSGNCTGNFISYLENTPSIDPQANSVEVTKIK